MAKPESPGEDVLSKAAGRGSAFDHQLYLFEALGALISLLGTQPQQQVNLLQALLQPLIASTSAAASSQLQDASALLKLHHAIKAIGNVAYGFPEIKNHATTPAGAWVAVVISAMESALQALKTNNKIAVIREAVSRNRSVRCFALKQLLRRPSPPSRMWLPAPGALLCLWSLR